MKGGTIPKVLEPRLLIDDVDRQVLNAMDELSPSDTGNLYVVGNPLDLPIPTVDMIARRLEMPETKVLSVLEGIRQKWDLPEQENLPTNNGMYDENTSLIHTLVNQHRLRWDGEIEDYRIPRVHMYSAEMGTGTLFTDNKAFLGEKIVRQAMNIDEMLNSYHIQGGIMPEIIEMFGKAKNQRALLIGLNKSRENGEENERELDKIHQMLQLGEHELEQRDYRNLEKYVINTLDSMEEAARSVAYEIAPLVENIPEHVPIHMYYSYNDDANLSELEDTLIASLRKIHRRMAKATKVLPEMREEYRHLNRERAELHVNKRMAHTVFNFLSDKTSENKEITTQGKEFKGKVKGYFRDGNKRSTRTRRMQEKLWKEYNEMLEGRGRKSEFNTLFRDGIDNYFSTLTTLKQIGKFVEAHDKRWGKLDRKVKTLDDEIAEEEQFENAFLAEQVEGHSWFTQKIAIKPTEAKVMEMIKKDSYKRLYTDVMIPEIKRIVGRKNLDIYLHTDREITVYVPDPSVLMKKNEFSEDLVQGTVITSIPRTNRQRSNEPLQDTIKELQGFQENAIAGRLKLQKERPRRVSDLNKRDFASSDVYLTSWGADGYRSQVKFMFAPTTSEGEYRLDPEITTFIKNPTRHDIEKLTALMNKGNKGTWHGKRIEKGGVMTGNTLQIYHPDQSMELFFFDDDFYHSVADEHGEEFLGLEEKIKGLEGKIKRAHSKKSIEAHKKNLEKTNQELQNLCDEIRPDMKYMFLANDLHIGAANFPGRPTNTDVIRSSQLAALQSVGFNNISFAFVTEALHGELGSPGFYVYDSRREGYSSNPITLRKNIGNLTQILLKQGASKKEVMRNLYLLMSEQTDSRTWFTPEDQKNMFREIEQPLFEEMMENDVLLYIGSGNHWGASQREDEASVLANMFDRRYIDQGVLQYGKNTGEGSSINQVKLPSNPGVDIKAVLSHRLWSGSTEVSGISKQATGTKDEALFFIAGDRHQPGAIAERGRYGIIDIGKQPYMAFVKMIGKATSVRGTMLAGYGMNRELMFSTRYFIDPIVDKIIGWEDRAGILEEAHDLIKNETARQSIERERNYHQRFLEK